MSGLYEISGGVEYPIEEYAELGIFKDVPVIWQAHCHSQRPFGKSHHCLGWCDLGVSEAAEITGMPASKGMLMKYSLGTKGHYQVGIPVRAEDIPKREVKFREYMAPILEDPWKYWNDTKAELDQMWKPVKEFARKVEEKENYEITMFLDEVYLPAVRKAWRTHFLIFYPFIAAYMGFEEMSKEFLGIDDSDVKFRKLFQGYEHEVFQMDRKLWLLSRRSEELGLKEIFDKAELGEILTLLGETENGRKWIGEFNDFLNEHGWRNEQMMDSTVPGWVDDPAGALSHIKEFMARGGEFSLDRIREGLAEERENLIVEFCAKVPDEPRPMFLALLRTGQVFQVINEVHSFLIEQPIATTLYHIAKELGKRYQIEGALDDWDDVFWLSYGEVVSNIFPAAMLDFRKLVDRRKKLWEEMNRKIESLPYIGDPTAVEMDPCIQKNIGLGYVFEPRPGVDIVGLAVAPGVAEGIARVIEGPEQFDEVKPGDILVAHLTFSVWTPLFARIAGAVTELGGTLGHTAIVAREYGIPAVTAASGAMSRIRSGQRIRVDGNEGAVYILD